jgi:hypothetical protein
MLLSAVSLQINAEEEFKKSTLWDSILTFLHMQEPIYSKYFEVATAATSLNYVTLPAWKSDHQKWGWGTNITYQIFGSGYFSQDAMKVLANIEERTRNIATQTSDVLLVRKAIEAHWLAGGLIILAPQEIIDEYIKKINQNKIMDLKDEEFVQSINQLTFEILSQASFAKKEIDFKNYKYIYENLLENPGDLFVVKDQGQLLYLKEIFIKDMADLFQKKTFDPLLDFNSSLITYDISQAIEQKGISSSDYAFGIIKQVYQMLSDNEQAMMRAFINVADKDAISDLAFNIYFFSGLVDIGWNIDIISIRKNFIKALGTTVVLKGAKAFTTNSDFAKSISQILEKVKNIEP